MRRCRRLLSDEGGRSQQWPFGRPEARGTARQFVPYAKKTLEGVAAAMADKKQDPPILASLLQHLPHGGIGWRVARNHWNLSGEVLTFATVTEVFHRRPPYELMVTSGYMTVDGETSNCPVYLPQQHYAGWTALSGPEPEEVDASFVDRAGRTAPFSRRVYVTGVDWMVHLGDLRRHMEKCGEVRYCEWEPEAYDKSSKQAIVEYSTIDAAKAAYEQLHDADLGGLALCVEVGTEKVKRPPSIGTDVDVDFSFGRMPTEPSINW